jgi:hypothetical protein
LDLPWEVSEKLKEEKLKDEKLKDDFKISIVFDFKADEQYKISAT